MRGWTNYNATFAIEWRILNSVTIALFALTLLLLPFSRTYATVTLLAIVALWSRIPGVGAPSPGNLLYFADLVDFLSMIIAVKVGGPTGAFFSVFCNLTSRGVGVTPPWLGVVNDTIAQFLVCLFIPLAYAATGSLMTTMIMYSVARGLIIVPLNIIEGRRTVSDCRVA